MDFHEIDKALSDPGFFVAHDPHPLWRQLRQEDPVHWTEDLLRGFWSDTRYDDIIAVVSAPATFTSSQLISHSARASIFVPARTWRGLNCA